MDSKLDERILLNGLTFGCPFGADCSCPQLKEIRELSVHDRLKWVDSLSDKEVSLYVQRHRFCLYEKEKEIRYNISMNKC